MNEQQLQLLESRVEKLLRYKNARIAERLTIPIDTISDKTIHKDMLIFTGRVQPAITNILTDFIGLGLGLQINEQVRYVMASNSVQRFTVDATSDIITNTSGAHNLKPNDIIYLTSTSTLPSPLSTISAYYVIYISGSTFKVSASSGGSAIDITDTGLGEHFWGKI